MRVRPDTKGFTREADPQATRAGRSFGKKFALVAGLAVAAAGAAIAAAPKILEVSGRLEQMGQKAATVFGKQLPVVERWAKSSSAAMGLTSRQLTGLTANFGDLLIPMGFGRQEAAKMSREVLGLAGALSKWTGGQKSAEEVAQTLAKAMLGEREELKGLGISITEADVKQRLLKKGQDDLTGSALQQAKAIATQELIFEKSKDAQASFAKGSGDLLDVKNRLVAKLKDYAETLLVKAMPAIKGIASFTTNTLVPALDKFAGFIEKTVVPAVRDGLGKLDKKIDLSGIGKKLGEDAKDWAGGIIGGVRTGLESGDWSALGKALGKGLRGAISKIGDISGALGKWASSVDWVEIGKSIGGKAAGFAIGFVSALGDDLFSAEFWKKHWWDFVLAALSVLVVGKIAGPLSKLFAKIPILKWFAPFLDKLNKITEPINKVLFGIFKWFGKQWSTGFRRVFPDASKGLRHFWNLLITWLGVRRIQLGAWATKMIDKFIGGMVRGLGEGTGRVLRWIGRLIDRAVNPFRPAGRWLVNRGRQLVSGLASGIASFIGRVIDRVRRIRSRVIGYFRRAGSWLRSAGRSLIHGLWNGISSMGGWLVNKIRWFISRFVTGPAKRMLGISSPSRVFAELGRQTMAGYAAGVDRGAAGVNAAVNSAIPLPGRDVAPAAAGGPFGTLDMNLFERAMDRAMARALDGLKLTIDDRTGVLAYRMGRAR